MGDNDDDYTLYRSYTHFKIYRESMVKHDPKIKAVVIVNKRATPSVMLLGSHMRAVVQTYKHESMNKDRKDQFTSRIVCTCCMHLYIYIYIKLTNHFLHLVGCNLETHILFDLGF